MLVRMLIMLHNLCIDYALDFTIQTLQKPLSFGDKSESDWNVNIWKSSKVELVVSCKNLRNADTFSKSDPFVVMFTADDRGGWKEYGRTETIDDNLNPEFAKKFTINYR